MLSALFVQISKAALLHNGADYIKTLSLERQRVQKEIADVRKQIESLNDSIKLVNNYATFIEN